MTHIQQKKTRSIPKHSYAYNIDSIQNEWSWQTDQVLSCVRNGEHLLGDRVAVAVTGSFARGCPTIHSDLDLVILTDDSVAPRLVREYRARIAEHTGRSVALQVHPQLNIHCSPIIQTLANLWLPWMSYIGGDRQVYRKACANIKAAADRIPWQTVAERLLQDPFRSPSRFESGSPHSSDLKYGYGGLFDYQIVELIAFRPDTFSLVSAKQLSLLRYYQLQIDIGRTALHQWSGESCHDIETLSQYGSAGHELSEDVAAAMLWIGTTCDNYLRPGD